MARRWGFRIGVGLAVALLLLALLGPLIAPYGIDEAEPTRYVTNADGSRVPDPPPYPPSREHLLGTDSLGYDILTRLLHGARYTLAFVVGVAAVRVALAFGVAAVGHLWYHARRPWRPRTTVRGPLGTAIPEFIIAYIALVGIAFNPPMSVPAFALLQGVLLAVIGLPGLVPTLRSRMERAAAQPFVEAQVAAGAEERHIFRRTVVPFVAGDLVRLLAHEALLVALITGELALFNVFVGGTRQYFDPPEFYSRSHEWVGMVGENAVEVLGPTPRLLLLPLAAYLLVIITLVLLGNRPARSRVGSE